MNLMILAESTISTLVSLILVFFLCELGQMVSDQYEFLNDEVSQCDWYSFPMEMQRFFMVFISFTQHPVLIQGFGNTRCVRDTFKNVRYSTLLRTTPNLSFFNFSNFFIADDSYKLLLFYVPLSNERIAR